MTKQDDVKGVG